MPTELHKHQETISNILSYSGLNSALAYILCLLNKSNISRIQCSYTSTKLNYNVYITSVDTSSATSIVSPRFHKAKFLDKLPASIHHVNFAESFVSNNREVAQNSYQEYQDFNKFSSLYNFPINYTKDDTLFFMFFSTKKNNFSEQVCAELSDFMQKISPIIIHDFELNNIFTNLNMLKVQSQTKHLLSSCPGLDSCMQQVELISRHESSVLLLGETGVGKELFANTIHENSEFNDGPLIKVNCGAMPESLVDSLLFGHEKGSFTGAFYQSKGYFEQANGGTLFLDEIGELGLDIQSRFLRVLDRQSIQRLGSSQIIPLNFRLIVATHKDLKQMVKEGRFRQDLWYRLAQYVINIPPLRERKEDILPLTRYFISKKLITKDNEPLLIPESEKEKLLDYFYPGNVRELEYIISSSIIEYEFSKYNKRLQFNIPDDPVYNLKEMQNTELGSYPLNSYPLSSKTNSFNFRANSSLEDIKNQYINYILDQCHGTIDGANGAAKKLQIHPQTLYKYLKDKKKD